MCRSIKPLFNFEPPATDEEIRAASLQFVRKLSGFQSPSKANEAAFERAVVDVRAAARRLVDSLVTTAPARNREEVAAAARARSAKRFGPRSPRPAPHGAESARSAGPAHDWRATAPPATIWRTAGQERGSLCKVTLTERERQAYFTGVEEA